MINGKRYSYENISVAMQGTTLPEVTEVNYSEKVTEEKRYVLGSSKPVAGIQGPPEYTGSIGMTRDQYDDLQEQLPKGLSLTRIDAFDITVQRLGKNDRLITDVLRQCKFIEVTNEFKSAESHAEIVLPLSVGDILYNV